MSLLTPYAQRQKVKPCSDVGETVEQYAKL